MKSFLIAFVSVSLVYMGTKILCVYFRPYDYSRAARAITFRVAKKLKQEKGLYLIGFGGGITDHGRVLSVHFDCFEGELNIETCRKLTVDIIEEYLMEINSDPKIRPFLSNYPFTSENIHLLLGLYAPGKLPLPDGKISFVSEKGGYIRYIAEGGSQPFGLLIKKELYEEAKKLVEQGEREEIVYSSLIEAHSK